MSHMFLTEEKIKAANLIVKSMFKGKKLTKSCLCMGPYEEGESLCIKCKAKDQDYVMCEHRQSPKSCYFCKKKEKPPKRSWEEDYERLYEAGLLQNYGSLFKQGMKDFLSHTIEEAEKVAYQKGLEDGQSSMADVVDFIGH